MGSVIPNPRGNAMIEDIFIDIMTKAARLEIEREIFNVETTVHRLLKRASKPKWRDHPIHVLHDKIVEHYAPLLAQALKDATSGVRSAAESAKSDAAKKSIEALIKNDDQPRDADGRFASGGNTDSPVANIEHVSISDGVSEHFVATNSRGDVIGHLDIGGPKSDHPGEIEHVKVATEYRRQGVATALLSEARSKLSFPVVHSSDQTASGSAWADVAKTDDQPRDADGRFASGGGTSGSGWKPSMTPEEADRWSAGSAIQGPMYHGTSLAAGSAIQSSGFDVSRVSENTGNYGVLGRGIYMSKDTEAAHGYASGSGKEGSVLELRVNVQNPADADTTVKLLQDAVKSSGSFIGSQKFADTVIAAARELGFDALQMGHGSSGEAVVFEAHNITVVKS